MADWCDITTDCAEELVHFYEAVMGWQKQAIDMGGYSDYVMMKPDGTPIGGICHKRGVNSELPGGWINYFTVDSVEKSLAALKETGGTQVGDVKHHGSDLFCVALDPSGAPFALYEKGSENGDA